MMGAAGSIIGGLFSAIGGFFNWKASPHKQYSDAEKAVEESDAAIRKSKLEMDDAVHKGNEEAVNKIINGCAVLAVCAALACGCVTSEPNERMVRVPADRWVRCVTNELGQVKHWEVPPVVMSELLGAKLELEQYKKQTRINERLMK